VCELEVAVVHLVVDLVGVDRECIAVCLEQEHLAGVEPIDVRVERLPRDAVVDLTPQ